ncbi:MAG: hypothetical protein RBQ97_02665 [Acholeplasma sp.]|nr:hypothetical protein [Acholeplasma sp.]
MVDKNAKAPNVRSGDDMNPVLAKIIKITALVVIVALVVVITLVVIEFINRNKKDESAFDDKAVLVLSDFNVIINNEGISELTSTDVKDIMKKVDSDDNIYFYFYYGSLVDDIEEELKSIKTIDLKEPIFFIDLEADLPTEDGSAVDYYLAVIRSNQKLVDLNIATVLDAKDSSGDNVVKYKSFIVVYNEDKGNEGINGNPFEIVKTSKSVLEILNAFEQIVEEE